MFLSDYCRSLLKSAVLPVSVFSALFSLPVYASDSGFEFHGYMRTGFGKTISGDVKGDQECVTLDTVGYKYRLGNECDTYVELAFSKELYHLDEDKSFQVHTRLAYSYEGHADYESDSAGADDESNSIAAREFYGTAAGVLGDANVWLGKRLYKRHDVYLNDFYFLDYSGQGAGIEEMDVGVGDLSYAIIQQVNSNQMHHDFRLAGIDIGFGSLEVVVNYVSEMESEDYSVLPGTENLENSDSGLMFGVIHTLNGILGGYNKFSFQYAFDRGTAMDGYPTDYALDDTNRIRMVNQLVWHYGDKFSGMFVGIFDQWTRGDLSSDPSTKDARSWLSFGVRPIWHISQHLNVAFEASYDDLDNLGWTGESATLQKLTIAPQISMDSGFWSRPVFRFFITQFNWEASEEFAVVKQEAAPNIKQPESRVQFAGEDSGQVYGFQFEAWW